MRDYSLNAAYWDRRGDEQARQAIQRVNPIPTDINSAGELALGKAAVKLGGSAAGAALSVYGYAQLGVSVVQFLEGLRSEALGDVLAEADPEKLDRIRDNLRDLRENAEEIRSTTNDSDLRAAYTEREELLRDTYELLPAFTRSVYGTVSSDPVYGISALPGTSYNLGRTSYSGVRGTVGQLRLALALDYHATQAYLTGQTDTTHIARTFSKPYPAMPTHNLDYSTQTARAYDSLDVPDDYAVYDVTLSSGQAESAQRLELRVRSPDTGNFTAYATESGGFDNLASPQGESFTETYGDRRLVVDDPEAGSYRVLVKSENRSLPYRLTATVVAEDPIPLIDLNRSAPELRVREKGFTGVSDAEIPDEPEPELVDTHLYPTDEGFRVTVTGANDGEPAAWQSVAVGLEDLSGTDAVSVVDNTLGTADSEVVRAPGESIGASYGTATTTLDYPLAEAASRPWRSGRESLVLDVEADRGRTYGALFKSVARANGSWYAAPEVGATDAVDGQSEFVVRRNLTLRSYETPPAETWRLAGGAPDRTGTAGATDGPTHEVDDVWETRLPDAVGSPVIVEDTVYTGVASGNVVALNRSTGAVRWNRSVGEGLAGGPAFEQGVLTVGTGEEVVMLNAADGSPIGRHSFGARIVAQPTPRDGTLFVPTADGTVHALDLTTDRVEWTASLGATPAGSPTVAGSYVYATTESGSVVGLDRVTGNERWRESTGAGPAGAPAVRDGVVYVSTTGGEVRAYDRTSGALDWGYHVGGDPAGRVAVTGERVYVAADRRVTALSTDGTWEWTTQLNWSADTAPVVTNRTLYVGSDDGRRLFALDAADGSRRWTRADRSYTTPVAPVEGSLFAEAGASLTRLDGPTGAPTARFTASAAGTDTGVALDATGSTGAASYEYDVDGDGTFETSGAETTYEFDHAGAYAVTLRVVGPDGTVDTTTRRVTAGSVPATDEWADGRNGARGSGATDATGPAGDVSTDWTATVGSSLSGGAVVADGVAYAPTADGRLVAVDAADGTTRWSVPLDGTLSTPAVDGETVYVTAGTDVVAVDAARGSIRWRYATDRLSVTAPVVDDGSVYVATRRKHTYSFGDRGDDTLVYALDAGGGTVTWTQRLERNRNSRPSGPVTLAENTLYVAMVDGDVGALSRSGGEVQWTRGVVDRLAARPVVDGDRLHLLGVDGDVVALDRRSRSVQWRYRSGLDVDAPPAVAAGRIVVAGTERVTAVDVATGRWAWTHRIGSRIDTPPTATANSVYVGSSEGRQVYGLDAADGSVRWNRLVPAVADELAVTEGRVLVGGDRGLRSLVGPTTTPTARFGVSPGANETTVALDASGTTTDGATGVTYEWDLDGDGTVEATGRQVTTVYDEPGEESVTLRVRTETGPRDETTRRVSVGQDDAVWSTGNGDRRRTGTAPAGPTRDASQRWDIELPGTPADASVVVDGVAYAATGAGTVHAVDLADGSEQWRLRVDGTPTTPTVENGSLYFAADSTVYAVDTTEGTVRWRYATDRLSATTPVVDDGSVYVATRRKHTYSFGDRGDDTLVYALDARDGTVAWRQRFERNRNSRPSGPVTLTESIVLVSMADGVVAAVDRGGGGVRWTTDAGDGAASPVALSEEVAYAATESGTVVALDLRSGTALWRSRTGERIDRPPAVVDGRVFVAADRHLYAFDAATGAWRWSTAFDDRLTTDLAVTDDSVYVGSAPARRLYAVDTADGSRRVGWRVGAISTVPAVLDSRLLYGSRSGLSLWTGETGAPTARIDVDVDGRTVRADADTTTATGTPVAAYEWEFDGDGEVDARGENVTYRYAAAGDERVRLTVRTQDGSTDVALKRVAVGETAPDWRDGARPGRAGATDRPGLTGDVERRWRTQLNAVPRGGTVRNGTVVVGTADGRLSALDGASGRDRWTAPTGDARPAVRNGTVYATDGTVVEAANLTDGSVRWRYATDRLSATDAVADEGRVYVATRRKHTYSFGDRGDDTLVYALDARDGTVAWRQRFERNRNSRPAGPPTLGENTVHVAMRDGQVAALDRLTGSVRWERSVGANTATTPPVREGGLIYVGSASGDVRAFDARTGEIRRNYSVNGTTAVDGLAVAGDDLAVVHGADATLLDRSTGATRWSFRSEFGGLRPAIALARESVYVASDDAQRVWGLDRRDGSVRWVDPTLPVTFGPVPGNDTVYYGAGDSVYALDGAVGGPSAAFAIRDEIRPGATVTLDASRSVAYDGAVVAHEWDLDGDGEFETTGETVETSWSAAGERTVALRVRTEAGATDVETRTVRVPDVTDPDAALSANRTVVAAGRPVALDAGASTDDRAVAGYAWRTSEGSFGPDAARTVRRFDEPGVYNVTVNVTDRAGNTDTAWTVVSVVSEFGRNLSATRTIRGSPRVGETVSVSVTVETNASVAGPTFAVDVPDDLELVAQEADPDATYKPSTDRWLWERAAAGERLTVEYTLRVPEDAVATESFRLRGSASGYGQTPVAVGGDTTVEVSTCVDRAVAGADGRVSLSEVRRALNWWAEDTPVPETGGTTLSMADAQRYVHLWRTNATVGCSTDATTADAATADAAAGPVDVSTTVSRERVEPGDVVTVRTQLETDETAPGVSVEAPANLTLATPEDGEAFRDDTSWIWLADGSKTLSYELRVPEDADVGNYTVATTGSAIAADGDRETAADRTTVEVAGDVNDPPTVTVTDRSTVNNAGAPIEVDVDASDPDGSLRAVLLRGPDGQVLANRTCAGDCTLSGTIESTWTGTGYETVDLTVAAIDADGATRTRTVETAVYAAGDATGDGVVDVFDAVAVGRGWQATRGSPGYTPAGDLNNDGEVDILDAVIVGNNWQEVATARGGVPD